MTDRHRTRTTIRVNDLAPGTPINPGMCGVFFEDINYSADGGLYAELIRNRDFSFSPRDAPGWEPLTGWARTGSVHVEGDPVYTGPHRVILEGRDAVASMSNSGFDGIPFSAGEMYEFTVVAEAVGGDPVMRVILRGDEDEELATAELRDLTESTREYTAQVRSDVAAGHGTLELEVTRGAVRVSWVSLFPTSTFRGSKNGMRSDLAEAIAELQPKFVRFPGGCVAHGLGLENLYRWKDTIGPVRERRGDFNLWGYHQSMGIGYFEYFRFCEQLGAEPLPVLAAGVCCQNSPGGQAGFSGDQFDAYIEDVLDLIEYANGPAESRWGSARVAAGHPEPFGLRYLGIGNEDEQSALFRDRFAILLNAVRSRHPEITVIGTVGPFPYGSDYDTGWEIARELNVDIVDEHSYKAPKWYFENLDRFDHYDRSGPAVYLGEYGSKGNTMLCALAEAAYMMAMERNGDIVRLASYAPLLARHGHTQWEPDLIYFDNDGVYPTLNYHVQRMHALSAGTRSLPVSTEAAPRFRRALSDRVAVTVRAKTGTLLVKGASVEHSGGTTTAPSTVGEGEVALPFDERATDYTVRVQVALEGGFDGFVVAFGDVGSGYFFEWSFGTWQNRFLVLSYVADGLSDEWTEPMPHDFAAGRRYDLTIRVTGRGQTVTCSIDGETVHDIKQSGREEQRFSATAVMDERSGKRWVKLVNATGEAVDSEIALESGSAPKGLRVRSLTAQADAGEPFAEAPAQPLDDAIAGNSWTIPPFTFATLELVEEG